MLVGDVAAGGAGDAGGSRQGRAIEQRGIGPGGLPIGRALLIVPSSLPTEVEDAIRAVESVHGDGRLPPIPLRLNPSLGTVRGRFRFDDDGPISISLNARMLHIGLATVHEIGHFLDFSGIGPAGQFASASDQTLRAWRDAMQGTRQFARLSAAVENAVSGLPRRAQLYRETLLPEELWARSYAQYITACSQNATLLASVRAFRETDDPAEYDIERLLHWDDDDFVPVALAIEALFQEMGWRSEL